MNIQRSFQKHEVGTLYLVPTPIGNLSDMTFRAVEVLKTVDLIASEDTRNTQKLLNHFEISKEQISLHEHNYKERVPVLLEKLEQGLSIAQVSDAGMPSISDPGHELVVAAIEKSIPVVSIPGATAGMTALIASGISAQPFQFYGFLPRKKKEQIDVLEELQSTKETLIFYESPHRVRATVDNFSEVFGKDRKIAVVRELTKIHEEYIRGTISEVAEYLSENELKGEVLVIVEGNTNDDSGNEWWSELSVMEHVNSLIAKGDTSKNAIKEVAKVRGLKKQEVYKEFHTS